jgi:hypothetical protein
MPRIPEVGDEGATPEQLALFDADRATGGDVLNTTRIYAYRPGLRPPLKQLHAALAGLGGVDPALVSLARLRTAGINGCLF